jgi:solute carrier family 9 (sodium/hydrogen exchanger), member 8
VFFGGSTLPLLKFLQPGKKGSRRLSQGRSTHGRSGIRSQQKEKTVSLSKTKEFGQALDSEQISHSELTEEEEVQFSSSKLGGFARLDRKYFIPFFTRIFSNQVKLNLS